MTQLRVKHSLKVTTVRKDRIKSLVHFMLKGITIIYVVLVCHRWVNTKWSAFIKCFSRLNDHSKRFSIAHLFSVWQNSRPGQFRVQERPGDQTTELPCHSTCSEPLWWCCRVCGRGQLSQTLWACRRTLGPRARATRCSWSVAPGCSVRAARRSRHMKKLNTGAQVSFIIMQIEVITFTD